MANSIAKKEFEARQKAAENFLKMEFVTRLRKLDLNDSKISSIIKTNLLEKISKSLFSIYESGRHAENIKNTDLNVGCGGDIKWMLIRAYFRDYGGTRFPRIYAERCCKVDTDYESFAIQEKFTLLEKMSLLEKAKSEHIDCLDVILLEDFTKIMDAFYELQANAYVST